MMMIMHFFPTARVFTVAHTARPVVIYDQCALQQYVNVTALRWPTTTTKTTTWRPNV